jgi:cytochrome oxidase Cu insertion factor (SCO1/SenC/PrrC family)
MQVKYLLFLGLASVLFLVAGLQLFGVSGNRGPDTAVAPQDVPQIVEAAVVQPFVKGSIAAIEASRQGRPFVLAFWSTTCIHCILEMTTWRKLRADHREFDLVMVSTDPIAETERIQEMLIEEGLADVESWAFDDSLTARLRSDVDKRWRGELPRIHFYDRQGRRTVRIGAVPESDVRTWFRENRL